MSTLTLAGWRVAPWSGVGRRRLVVLVAVAAVVIVASWFLAAGRNDPGDQLAFVSLSLFGLACEVSGVSRFVREGRCSIRSYRRELFGALADPAADVAPADVASSDDLMARPDGRWIHRADCPLVRGRQWEPVPPGAGHEAGRRPCPACRP